MILALQVVVLLLVAGVNTVPESKVGCSKEWLRYLIITACNYSKRNAIFFSYIDDDSVDHMTEIFLNPLSEVESGSYSSEMIIDDGNPISEISQLSRTLLPLNSLNGASNELKEEMLLVNDYWERRRRGIRELVEKCCIQVCTVDEFKGLCYA